jgi:tyrosyl-tRNA synthetase
MAIEASEFLFGKGTTEILRKMNENTLLSVFEGVPQFILNKNDLAAGVPVTELLADKAAVFPSKGEVRRMIKGGGLL